MDLTDVAACYRVVESRDPRFDGVFYTGVRTTGIYCRPSCPARTPHQRNITFFRTPAAALAAGFRACRRCIPDATPGSPEWDVAADVAGRAMRLIADGVVEREGIDGLASRLGYSARHLGRVVTRELGAGPLALARARRAQNARTLVESTAMPFSDVAFAAGFASVRQFNDTMREVYACSPSELRGHARLPTGRPGRLELRLAVRAPYAASETLAFLRARLVDGVEMVGTDSYARSLRLPHGHGVVRLDFAGVRRRQGTDFIACTLHLTDMRDLGSAVERSRRLLDADCDPVAVDSALRNDPVLGRLVKRRPGLRVPGHVDGNELAVRAVLGQQVTVRSATAMASRLAERFGEPVETGVDGVDRLFPTADVIAGVTVDDLPLPRTRARALTGLCAALAAGDVVLDRSAPRDAVRQALLALPGIGPWTADYVALRALGDPDVFLPADAGVRRALDADFRTATVLAERWRPWRSYALMHLWNSLTASAGKAGMS